MGGPPLPEFTPDLRQGWVEKWLLLALENSRQSAVGSRQEEDAPSLSGDALARALGAKELKAQPTNGN